MTHSDYKLLRSRNCSFVIYVSNEMSNIDHFSKNDSLGQEMERTQNPNSLTCHLHKHFISMQLDPVPYSN